MSKEAIWNSASEWDKHTSTNNYYYGHAVRWDGNDLWGSDGKLTCSCDRGVGVSLYKAGLIKEDPSKLVLEGHKLTDILLSKGWKKITDYCAVLPGDIVWYDNDNSHSINWRDHVFIVGRTTGERYDWGSQSRIRHEGAYKNGMPFKEAISRSLFLYAMRMPSDDWSKIESGTYEIVSALDAGYALDLEKAKKTDGAAFRLWKRNGTNAQKFTVKLHSESDGISTYAISVKCSGLVMETKDGKCDKGTTLRQLKWNGCQCQLWKFRKNDDGTYTIFNAGAGLPIDVRSAIVAKGTEVRLWKDNGTKSQKWNLVKV